MTAVPPCTTRAGNKQTMEEFSMNVRTQLSSLVGEWAGTNRVWLMPGEPVRESVTAVSIALAARDGFVTFRYTWADSGQPQDGLLIVRNVPEPGGIDMVWLDSWHTGGQFMVFQGEADRDGRVSALTSYPAPTGPDWGWRIELATDMVADTADEFVIRMYNIQPGVDEMLAVEARYGRVHAA